MTKKKIISADEVKHLAKLASLTPPADILADLESGVESTLEYAEILSSVDVSNVKVTNEVTGLKNVWREDLVDDSRTFTQEQALANSSSTHNGFFMVDAILE